MIWTRYLIGAVSAVVLAVTDKLVVDTLAVGAVVGSSGAGRDPAHEWHESLTGGQLPFLTFTHITAQVLHDGADALARHNIGLAHGPVTVVLGNLVPSVSLQGVGLQVIVGLQSQPVGRGGGLALGRRGGGTVGVGREELRGQVGGEVVLTEGFHGCKIGAIPEIYVRQQKTMKIGQDQRDNSGIFLER